MTRRGEAETQIAAFARFAAFVSARFASSSSKVTVRSLLQGGSPLLHLHTVATAASSYSRHCGIFIQSPSLRQWNIFTAASSYSRHCGIFIQSPSLRHLHTDCTSAVEVGRRRLVTSAVTGSPVTNRPGRVAGSCVTVRPAPARRPSIVAGDVGRRGLEVGRRRLVTSAVTGSPKPCVCE